MNSPFVRELSWPEVKSRLEAGAVALLPTGSTEAHGPHLPLSVDVLIAEEVCRRVAARRQAQGRATLVFPALAYAVTDFAASFSGTVSLPESTAHALVRDVCRGIASHGAKNIVVVNHHLEPANFRLVHKAAKEAASLSGARIDAVDHRRDPWGPRLGDEFMHGGSHAGFYETSLVLAAAPLLVDQKMLRSLPDLEIDLPARIKAGARTFAECGGADAYFGAPAKASAEEGERLFEILVEATEHAIAAP